MSLRSARVTDTSWTFPSRTRVSLTVSPAEYWRTNPVSAALWFVGLPSMAVMTSSLVTPAFAAGEPGSTVPTRAPARVTPSACAFPSLMPTPR